MKKTYIQPQLTAVHFATESLLTQTSSIPTDESIVTDDVFTRKKEDFSSNAFSGPFWGSGENEE